MVELLVEAGLLDKDAYHIKTLMNQVTMLETGVRHAADDFREKTGVIVNIGMVGRPQG